MCGYFGSRTFLLYPKNIKPRNTWYQRKEGGFIKTISLRNFSFTDIILVFSIIAFGGFYEWVSAALSVVLSAFILYRIFSKKTIIIRKNLLFFVTMLIVVSYLIVGLWAIDSGMSVIGAIKFLPVLLFLIAKEQEQGGTENKYQIIIATTSVMVVVSAIFSLIPQTREYFTVAGRLAGFFQYPNSFAMLILISELLLLRKEKFKVMDIAFLIVLILGLLYTGSRTVFVLLLISNITVLFVKTNKKFRLFALCFFTLAIILFLVFYQTDIVQRLLSISVFESTFIGRILYFIDALPLMLKYPFGMGYLGYNYIHPTIQTGVYTVRYVHNDFLQLFLDIGWIPAILFIFTIIKKVFSKNTDKYLKIIIITFCIHIFFDFDLQFLSMFLILVLLLEDANSKTTTIKLNGVIGGALALILALNTYMSLHLVFSYFGLEKQADRLYPWNTDTHIALLKKEQNLSKADELANDILKQNSATYIPYIIKANAAYANGDFNSLITYNRELINRAPFYYEHYENYARMLIDGIRKYKSVNDYESANFCIKELKMVNSALTSISSKLSTLGRAIEDQPKTEFPQEISEFINGLEE